MLAVQYFGVTQHLLLGQLLPSVLQQPSSKNTPLNPTGNTVRWEGRVKHRNLPNPQNFPLQQYWHPPLVETQLTQAGDDTCRILGRKLIKPQEEQSEEYTEHRMTTGAIARGKCMASARSGFLPIKKCYLILGAPRKPSISPRLLSHMKHRGAQCGFYAKALPVLLCHSSEGKSNCFHTKITPKIPTEILS